MYFLEISFEIKKCIYELRRHFWTLLHKIKVAQNSILHNKSDRPNYFDEI